MPEYEMRALTAAEDKYTFQQSSQITGQTGQIGYLRADMDTDGRGFFSSWNDCRKDLNTAEFKQELNEIIDSLREEGGLLHTRNDLARYCYSTPQSRMDSESEYYGVRADTDKYSYLFRLNPRKGEYNLYCYCYVREYLEDHMRQAEKGIRFIDSRYNELFRIPDGGRIMIHYSPDESESKICRYIDEYHAEIGTNLYHICEFAEKMERNGYSCEPVRETLPEHCYSTLPAGGEIIIIKRNERGYYKTDIPAEDKEHARFVVDLYNKKLGVSRAQEEAMRTGSMFGFAVPGADPKNYNKDGRPIRPKERDRSR